MGQTDSLPILNLNPCCNDQNSQQEIISEIKHNTSNNPYPNPYHLEQSVSYSEEMKFAEIEPNHNPNAANLPSYEPDLYQASSANTNTHFSLISKATSDDRTLGRRTRSNIDTKKIIEVSPRNQYGYTPSWIINEEHSLRPTDHYNHNPNRYHTERTATMIQVEVDDNGTDDEDSKEIINRSHNYSFARTPMSEYDVMGRLTYDSQQLKFNGANLLYSRSRDDSRSENRSRHGSKYSNTPELLPPVSYNGDMVTRDKTFSIPNNIKESLRVQGKVGSIGVLTNSAVDDDEHYVYPKNFN